MKRVLLAVIMAGGLAAWTGCQQGDAGTAAGPSSEATDVTGADALLVTLAVPNMT